MNIRDAEAATEVELGEIGASCVGELPRELQRRPLRLDQRVGGERLRAGEDVEALPVGARFKDAADQGGHTLRIDAERLGAAAHAHARALDLEVGIDADGEPRPDAQFRADSDGSLCLTLGFEVDGDAAADGGGQFGIALAGPAKLISSPLMPASSAISSSPPEARSMPSTWPATSQTAW
jgi:hypothetical protein